MSTLRDSSPQDQVAAQFMRRKGYRHIQPRQVEDVGGSCWYYYYDLPEGTVELEVFYDRHLQRWETMVTAFDSGFSASGTDTL